MNLKNNLKLPRINNKGNPNAAASAIIAGTNSNQKQGRNTIAHTQVLKNSGGIQMPSLDQKKMSIA